MVTLPGKDIYLGVHGTEESHTEYKRVIAAWLQQNKVAPDESRTGMYPGSGILDINELIVVYWQFTVYYYPKTGRVVKWIRSLTADESDGRQATTVFGGLQRGGGIRSDQGAEDGGGAGWGI